ncbi:MAG: exodeoxyribonuclease VII large subunit [Gammaproteobacteria bacterium]|nr:exodeoxyribonuclease VII large subunit [Gammaproteobacteria bacterium]HJP34481.1 exodeoxyribonuclease VII large subunit [Gammaproteobacteria bacterium]
MNNRLLSTAGGPAAGRDIYTVSRLTGEARGLLEREFGAIWIEGELSNVARPRSGHWYFSLKDESAQVRCAMFRSRNNLVGFEPAEGAHVVARARVGMYEPRGEFQLVVEQLELAGEGVLRLRFEQLKRRLAAEGLFDAERKQELPGWPSRIGVVTSPSGAAIRDILTVLKRRNPTIEVVVYPASVQGAKAAPELVEALGAANARGECNVLIVGRGGGSLEDLWPFNEESVARAIFASEIPVVSAVGHEIDFTIADLVADARAPTPSASAEVCSPHREEAIRALETAKARLSKTVQRTILDLRGQLRHTSARLQHPGRRLEQYHQRVDELMQRLPAGVLNGMQLRRSWITALTARIRACNPTHRITHFSNRIADSRRRLTTSMAANLATRHASLGETVRALRAVSPEATLQRGYAIVTAEDGVIARDARNFERGDKVTAQLARGRLALTVDAVEETAAAEKSGDPSEEPPAAR